MNFLLFEKKQAKKTSCTSFFLKKKVSEENFMYMLPFKKEAGRKIEKVGRSPSRQFCKREGQAVRENWRQLPGVVAFPAAVCRSKCFVKRSYHGTYR